MTGENGYPETPDWQLPARTPISGTSEAPEIDMPDCWLGEN